MERNTEIFKFFVGRERKGQAVFLPLVLLRGTEGVVQNCNGKTSPAAKRVRMGRIGVEGLCDFRLGNSNYRSLAYKVYEPKASDLEQETFEELKLFLRDFASEFNLSLEDEYIYERLCK